MNRKAFEILFLISALILSTVSLIAEDLDQKRFLSMSGLICFGFYTVLNSLKKEE
jgi:hypothetical protein